MFTEQEAEVPAGEEPGCVNRSSSLFSGSISRGLPPTAGAGGRVHRHNVGPVGLQYALVKDREDLSKRREGLTAKS